MKSIKLTGLNQLKMVDVPDPEIKKPDDVILRVGSVGMCGSDVHYFTSGNIGSQIVSYPFTVGHECSAIVESVGSGVTHVKPGDRVAVEPAISCHACSQCLSGRPHTCENLLFLGCPGQLEGCLSEFIVMPERCCFTIPDSMSLEVAALAEPLTIGYYAVELAKLKPDVSVAVLGAGPIGLSVMLCAQAFGADLKLVTDPLEYRRDVANSLHPKNAISPDELDQNKSCFERQFDVVFECCGKQEALDQAIHLLKPGGTLLLVGIPTENRISFSIDLLRRKEIRIQNVRRQCECLEKTLALIDSGKIDPSFMVTHRFSLDESAAAFDLVSNYRDGVIKAMINIQD